MRVFLTFLIGLLLGAVAGGALIFYLVAGVPRAAQLPGEPIKSPDANQQPAGTAVVTLKQEFFNQILQTIFRDLNAPAFPLGAQNHDDKIQAFGLLQESGCNQQITVKSQGSGVVTDVRFENGKIRVPLAFAGNYNAPFVGCTNFAGWADANLDLRYDAAQKTVFGAINVQTVNVDGITALAGNFVTPLVQQTLNQKVNPVQILRADQIALKIPIQTANGNLNANVSDIRAEIKDNALNLFVVYDFTGAKN